MKEQSLSEALRSSAQLIEARGFSSDLGKNNGGPRCFVGAFESVGLSFTMQRQAQDYVRFKIFDGVWNWCGSQHLRAEGWTTEDAVAALNVAADCAEVEEM